MWRFKVRRMSRESAYLLWASSVIGFFFERRANSPQRPISDVIENNGEHGVLLDVIHTTLRWRIGLRWTDDI